MNIDISDLKKEQLPTGKFPVGQQEPFRVHFAADVHAGTRAHATQDTTVEICGVLVGRWETDANGPYALITNYIRCEQAAQKHAEVTFTQDSWTHINKEMDTKYQDLRIIGWYHSHPDFGIFLSDRDCFIQQHFFSGPGQVALVIDPVRHLEGLFEWRDGKPCPMHHYWVGDRIYLGETRPPEQQAPRPDPDAPLEPVAGSAQPASASGEKGWLLPATIVLGVLSAFLLGQQLAMWQYQMELMVNKVEAIEHYGLYKKERLGLEPRLDEVARNLQTILQAVPSLRQINPEDSQRKAYGEAISQLEVAIAVVTEDVMRIRLAYGHTPSEMSYYNKRYEDAHRPPSREESKSGTASDKTGSESAPATTKLSPTPPAAAVDQPQPPKSDSKPSPETPAETK